MQQPNLAPFETAFTVVCENEASELISFDSLLQDARANNGQQQFKLKAFLDTQVTLLTNKSAEGFDIEQHLAVLADGTIVEQHLDKKVMSLFFPGVYEKDKPSAQGTGIKVLKGEVNIILRCTAVVDMGSGLVTGGVILSH